ncbi:hypothetical protein BBW65_01790 [Helicobacter enhydrae]|uniref:Motility integral membrane protein n=1 Tax=Helicobacter enhydrae TaxID=222136 RepID=A0A1B1U4C7_9HELI|nr:hypothetical protein [Helicobacter enhydrae]ANV97613.1 hypothetical protein BBW65_01790 [Helicobacter enhydrae]
MRSDNFISLAIVGGFFLGLIFGFIAFDDGGLVVLSTIIITSIFYLIAVLSTSAFYWFVDFETQKFSKKRLEHNLEYYIEQFQHREKELEHILDYIKKIDLQEISDNKKP